jgi:hypothetical protein
LSDDTGEECEGHSVTISIVVPYPIPEDALREIDQTIKTKLNPEVDRIFKNTSWRWWRVAVVDKGENTSERAIPTPTLIYLIWKRNYDSPFFRRAFNSGNFHVYMDRAVKDYFEWLSKDVVLTFESQKTGEEIQTISPKQGTRPYFRNKWRRVKEIIDSMEKLQFDFIIANNRGINKNCHFLLIMVTFKQDVTIEGAWY